MSQAQHCLTHVGLTQELSLMFFFFLSFVLPLSRGAFWFVQEIMFYLILRPLSSSDTVVVQVQQWRVVGTQQVVDQVLLNGVVLTDTKQVDIIIRTISADAHLLALTGANQTVTPGKKRKKKVI